MTAVRARFARIRGEHSDEGLGMLGTVFVVLVVLTILMGAAATGALTKAVAYATGGAGAVVIKSAPEIFNGFQDASNALGGDTMAPGPLGGGGGGRRGGGETTVS